MRILLVENHVLFREAVSLILSQLQQTFFYDKDYAEYRRLMASFCDQCETQVWAYCLMPNQVQLILVPRHEHGLRCAIAEAHRRYSRTHAKPDAPWDRTHSSSNWNIASGARCGVRSRGQSRASEIPMMRGISSPARTGVKYTVSGICRNFREK